MLLVYHKKAKCEAKISGKIKGINGIDFIIDVYPSILNDTYEWFTFDKEKFNLDSLEFNKTIQLYKDVRNSSAWYDPSTNYEGIDYLFENRLAANYDSTLSLEKYRTFYYPDYTILPVINDCLDKIPSIILEWPIHFIHRNHKNSQLQQLFIEETKHILQKNDLFK